MCVIIHKPEEAHIEEDILRACWKANKDGAGIMYAKDNVLYVEKGFMRFKKFYKAFKRLENNDMVVHFRYGTHGNIDKDMTHPFLVDNNLAVMHNGIISTPLISPEISDSYYFNKAVLQQLPNNFLENPAIVHLIESRINGSILVFLDNRGNIIKIGNRCKELIYGGCWFSNSYWVDIKNYLTGKETLLTI